MLIVKKKKTTAAPRLLLHIGQLYTVVYAGCPYQQRGEPHEWVASGCEIEEEMTVIITLHKRLGLNLAYFQCSGRNRQYVVQLYGCLKCQKTVSDSMYAHNLSLTNILGHC